MAHAVVYFLELVQVDHHDGERSARTRRALPLALHGFEEEAARLDAGKAVRNRLLLQLLEHERVVQRRGEQISQRTQDQHILILERMFVLALDVQHAEQCVAVGERQAQHRACVRQHAEQVAVGLLHQHHFVRPSDLAHDADAQRNAFPQRNGAAAGFGTNFDLFRRIIEHADADVIEFEVPLDFGDDLFQHLLGILAGDRRLRHAVKERQVLRATLLLGEEPRIFDGDGDLSRRGFQHVQVTRVEHVFVGHAHRHHDPGGPSIHQNGRGTKRFRGPVRFGGNPQPLPHMLEIGTDEQRLPGAQNIFGEAVGGLAPPLRHHLAFFDLEVKNDRVAFLKGHIKIRGVENLAQLFLPRAQHVLLIQARAHGLPDLGEQLIFLGPALGVVVNDVVSQRRTKEYQLLTQIGQAISSRLNQQDVLRTVQKELGQIFDTSNFYVAFQEGDSIVFHLEVEEGQVVAQRRRKADNGLTEYVLRTGQPLLIRSDLEHVRERLGVTSKPDRPSKSFCAAPILVNGRATGVMVAMSMTHEYMFDPRDLDVLKTAAGQVSVAIENARLFGEEQRRSRQFAFLNSVSKTAISSEDAEQMLADIVGHIQKNFRFDHIGIGILDYATKEIEIKVEAGTTAREKGKKIPVTAGIAGRVARTGEMAMVNSGDAGHLQGLLPGSRSVLCIPISYGDTLLGVLNVESEQELAFSTEDALVMNTLADLLATALHNSFVFQKLQQQSITDGLTSIKTRRFFWEALSSEWKRASRSGRPFSVVLVDLDKFKEVNDTYGHLEGDMVLARVGRLLEQKCRQSNVVARYGGDEFVILMPETAVEQAQILSERLRLWLATDPMLSEHHITGSFGVASFPVHGLAAEDIIRAADAGMYVSKKAGGDRVSTAEEPGHDQGSSIQRQLVSGYIEGFLQRERNGSEHVEELVGTLRKLSSGADQKNIPILRDSIEALARAAESRELNVAGHGDAVAQYSEMIARSLSLPPEQVHELGFAGRVHDVGKLFVSERILNKHHSLTDEEFQQLKMHPKTGAEIVGTLPNCELAQKAVLCHHEWVDGSGYPNGLRGEEIPLWARIIAVADAYVNLISDRSMAPGKTSDQALAENKRFSGIRFDGMLVRIWARTGGGEKLATCNGRPSTLSAFAKSSPQARNYLLMPVALYLDGRSR